MQTFSVNDYTFAPDLNTYPPICQSTLRQSLYGLLNHPSELYIEILLQKHMGLMTKNQWSENVMTFDKYHIDLKHPNIRGISNTLLIVENGRTGKKYAVRFPSLPGKSIINYLEKYVGLGTSYTVGQITLWYKTEDLQLESRVPVDQDAKKWQIRKPDYLSWRDTIAQFRQMQAGSSRIVTI